MEFIDCGRLSYDEGDRLQREYLQKRISGIIPDTVLMLEHEPVVTVGRLGSAESILSSGALKEREIDVLSVDRGGDATYHAPGQLVVYPIVDLKGIGQDIHLYLSRLEHCLAGLFLDFGLVTGTMHGKRGAWIGGKKIASIGIAVKKWIAYHGVSINVDLDLKPFSYIKMCGDSNSQATSMSVELGRSITVSEVKPRAALVFDDLMCGKMEVP